MKRVLGVVVVLSVVLAAALFYRVRALQAYRTAPAGGSGTIEGVEVNVTARMNARVQEMRVREGDTVTAGQVLAVLDCKEAGNALEDARARLALAEVNVRSARAAASAMAGNTDAARHAVEAAAAQVGAVDAQKDNAARESQRVASLKAVGAVTPSHADQANTLVANLSHQAEGARANEAAARARLEAQAGSQTAAQLAVATALANVKVVQAAVHRAEIAVGECTLVAPRDAVVFRRNQEPGEVAMPGSNLVTLVDLEEVRVTFYLPNAEVAAAVPGRQVTVKADAWPERSFLGMILNVSSKAEFTPRNVQTREDRDRLVYAVEVAIPNHNHLLRPGMPVEVVIEDGGHDRERP